MVTVRTKAFGDRRIMALARLAAYPGGDDEALGKMTRLWALCAEQQTDTPEVRHIRACLGPRGEEFLVESGLGDDKHRDPTLGEGVYRVRGCDETDWFLVKIEQEGQKEAGRARAALARRDAAGRYRAGAPPGEPAAVQPDSSQRPASYSPDSDLPESDLSSSASSPFSALPDPPTIVGAERGAPRQGPAFERAARRRRLFDWAVSYAASKHAELRRSGVDRNARSCWGGLPSATSTESIELRARIDELTEGDSPDWERAEEIIRNRVDVAAAEARRDGTLRWFIPARMWDKRSFDIAKDLSPEQAAAPRRGGGTEPRGPRKVVVPTDDPPPLPPTGGKS